MNICIIGLLKWNLLKANINRFQMFNPDAGMWRPRQTCFWWCCSTQSMAGITEVKIIINKRVHLCQLECELSILSPLHQSQASVSVPNHRNLFLLLPSILLFFPLSSLFLYFCNRANSPLTGGCLSPNAAPCCHKSYTVGLTQNMQNKTLACVCGGKKNQIE